MSYRVELIEQPLQTALVVHGHADVEGIPEFLGAAFREVADLVEREHLSFAGPPFGRYLPCPEGGFEVDAGFPVRGPVAAAGRAEVASLPGGLVARAMHQGPYDHVGAAYEAVEKWIADHDYEVVAPPWESYLDGPEVAHPRTEVAFPCAPRNHD